jgi:hypothetical protein
MYPKERIFFKGIPWCCPIVFLIRAYMNRFPGTGYKILSGMSKSLQFPGYIKAGIYLVRI